MEDEHRFRRVAISHVAGAAEAAADSVSNLRVDVAARLVDEEFKSSLDAELSDIRDRLHAVYNDLFALAYSPSLDGFRDERYRLAHRGEDPPGENADREQLEAIEATAAA